MDGESHGMAPEVLRTDECYSNFANGLTRYSFSTRVAFSASLLAAAKRVRSFFTLTFRARRRAISRLRSMRPIGSAVNLWIQNYPPKQGTSRVISSLI